MSLSHTVTKADVLRIHGEHTAFKGSSSLPLSGPQPEGWNARQATRTEVHALLQAQCLPPYHAPPTSGRVTRKESEALKSSLRASVTEEDHDAFARARAAGGDMPAQDAHHHAQREHGKALWVEADRLVDDALGKAVSS
jgi:hypothetical protein